MKDDISRRDFLKGVAALGAGVVVNSALGNPIGNGVKRYISRNALSSFEAYLFDQNNSEIQKPNIYNTDTLIPCRIEKYKDNGFIIRYIDHNETSHRLSSQIKTHYKQSTSLMDGGLYPDKDNPVIYATREDAALALPIVHNNFLQYIENMYGIKEKYSEDEVSQVLQFLNKEIKNDDYTNMNVDEPEIVDMSDEASNIENTNEHLSDISYINDSKPEIVDMSEETIGRTR